MYDHFNRNITYLRISVTSRCNLRCTYCMPSEGIKLKARGMILSHEEIIAIAQSAVKLGITKIRLTGGEPLIRKNICFLIHSLKSIPGMKEVTLTTNGVTLEQMARDLKNSGLDRINISLDTLNPEKYEKLTRGGNIVKVLTGIDAVSKAGFKNTKLNMVLIPGFNQNEVEDMVLFCRENGLKLQRINHYSLYDRNSSNHGYEAERPMACEHCNRIRLTADGKLKPCLFSNQEYLIDFEDIADSIKQAILSKPEKGTGCHQRGNWEIGG